jgi:hypothetical protein
LAVCESAVRLSLPLAWASPVLISAEPSLALVCSPLFDATIPPATISVVPRFS